MDMILCSSTHIVGLGGGWREEEEEEGRQGAGRMRHTLPSPFTWVEGVPSISSFHEEKEERRRGHSSTMGQAGHLHASHVSVFLLPSLPCHVFACFVLFAALTCLYLYPNLLATSPFPWPSLPAIYPTTATPTYLWQLGQTAAGRQGQAALSHSPPSLSLHSSITGNLEETEHHCNMPTWHVC